MNRAVSFLCFLPAVLTLASCASPHPEKEKPAAQTEPLSQMDTIRTINESGIADFQKKYAAFATPPAEVPEFGWTDVKRRSRKMEVMQTAGYRLTLEIGPRREAKSDGYRTASRYRLIGPGGQKISESESLLTADAIANQYGDVSVLYDAATNAFFIAEDISWCNRRFILMETGGRVRYLTLPERQAIPGYVFHTMLEGYHRGLVYIKTDGRVYALPLSELSEETDLTWYIG